MDELEGLGCSERAENIINRKIGNFYIEGQHTPMGAGGTDKYSSMALTCSVSGIDVPMALTSR